MDKQGWVSEEELEGEEIKSSKPIPHGTRHGYIAYRCRCDACKKASREYGRKRILQLQQSDKPVPHGTLNGYSNYKCKCEACIKAYRKYIREYSREYRRQGRLYGMAPGQYDHLYAKQNGLCAIEGCGRPIQDKDHNHSTDIFRGLLCKGCNLALGWLDDDIVRLAGLIDYLQEHDGFVSITGARLKRARELQARGVNKDTATI